MTFEKQMAFKLRNEKSQQVLKKIKASIMKGADNSRLKT